MNAQPLKVLIVDDSRIFRAVIEEALTQIGDVKIVGSVWSGEKALEIARQTPPDFVTLDIQMPGLGGLATLKALRAQSATQPRPLGVLLVSALTQRGAAVTIEGLQEGAFDFITKPDGPDPQVNAASLREQLREKIAAYRSSWAFRALSPSSSSPVAHRVPQTELARYPRDRPTEMEPARPRRSTRYRALVIGASTGGPEALVRVLPVVAPSCPVPIFMVQHMPSDFTNYFATSLSRRCGIQVLEARGGVVAQSEHVYLAPGGKHLVLHASQGNVFLGLTDEPPENGCRPSVDVLFRTAAVAYAGHILAVVLTGMGCDGAKGAVALKRAGAHVIVQDEATSVVWGMPGSTVAAGAADEVLAIDGIGAALRRNLGMGG